MHMRGQRTGGIGIITVMPWEREERTRVRAALGGALALLLVSQVFFERVDLNNTSITLLAECQCNRRC